MHENGHVKTLQHSVIEKRIELQINFGHLPLRWSCYVYAKILFLIFT